MQCDIIWGKEACVEEPTWWDGIYHSTCEKHKAEYLISNPNALFIPVDRVRFGNVGGLIISPPKGRRITNIKME